MSDPTSFRTPASERDEVDTRTRVAVVALLLGSGLFFLVFACVFNGYQRASFVSMLLYVVAGAYLARLQPSSHRLAALLLMVPPAPWIALISISLVLERGPLEALWWPSGYVAAALLSYVGAVIGASTAQR